MRRIVHRFSVLAILFTTGACAPQMMPTPNICVSPDKNPWDDVPPKLREAEVSIVYATDRTTESPDGKPLRYGSRRSASLAFGICNVRMGDGKDWARLVVESTRRIRGIPITLTVQLAQEHGRFLATPPKAVGPGETIIEADRSDDPAIGQLRKLVAERLADGPCKDIFVFIHGFNYGFEDAAGVMAQLWHFIGRRGVPVIYSWPAGSGLNLRGYNYDCESGEFTVYHLKQFLRALSDTPGLGKIHLIAHSRGAYVVASALRELNIECLAKNPDHAKAAAQALKIGHLVLAAPDIDLEVAQQRMIAEHLNLACERITIYTSPDDLAIAVARWLFDSTIRLGTLGILQLPVGDRQNLTKLSDLDVIDARVSGGLVGHDYFYQNPAVSSDLILLLRDNCPPGDPCRPLTREPSGFWRLRDGYPAESR